MEIHNFSNRQNIFLFLCISLLLITSCEKENDVVKDVDGNEYNTVTIGTQTWLIENLKTTKYRNGDPIQHITDYQTWINATTGSYSMYSEDPQITNTHGLYYNGYAVDDPRNIAPTGWHVATKAEWETLINFLGGVDVAGGKLKEAGTAHWQAPNAGATNETGFSALPSGKTNGGVQSAGMGIESFFWSSEQGSTKGYHFGQEYASSRVINGEAQKFASLSVRCIKD